MTATLAGEIESNNDLNLVLKCDSGITVQRKGKCISNDLVKFDSFQEAFSPLFRIPVDTVFDVPKDMEKGVTILRTRQADALTNEVSAQKGKRTFVDNFFVLSGPSGIGKSCIALSVAL